MRGSLFYIMVLGGFLSLFSCKNSENDHIRREMDHDIRMYHQAIKFGDVGTAIHAMQSLLAWDSSHKSYYDTLAILYFHSQNYPQAIQSAQVILDKDPNNIKLLQIVAHGYQYLGRQDMAIGYYTKLEAIKPEPLVYYELASSYLFLRDTGKINLYIGKIMNDKRSDTTKVHITFNQGHNEEDVPVKAASYNLLGTLLMNENNKEQAKAEYSRALEIEPHFALARQNLEFIEKEKTRK
jgi:tetratricopeptide (TPR) repeat protein